MSTDNTRDAEATRGAILVATKQALAERGTAVTVQEVADRAGVSKSGLLHHFASKRILLISVVTFYLDEMFDAVAELARHDQGPGSFTRAYVEALCGENSFVRDLFTTFNDISDQLSRLPGASELYQADTERWNKQFLEDGLDPDQLILIRYAAEGVAMAAGYDELMGANTLERAHTILKTFAQHHTPVNDLWSAKETPQGTH